MNFIKLLVRSIELLVFINFKIIPVIKNKYILGNKYQKNFTSFIR